ncbi:MAG: hypothetical protein FWF73_02375 [Spirochaetes bacterium]|nr:hypothetical protein [Spirochaetota bacterium]
MHDNLSIDENSIFIHLHREFKENDKIFSGKDSKLDSESKIKLRQFLESKGEELLRADGKPERKIEYCKLGYANAEAMVVFP